MAPEQLNPEQVDPERVNSEQVDPEQVDPERVQQRAIASVEQRAKIFAALSDPTRLRVVELLITGDCLSASELAAQVGISLALFCHHSKTLAEAGLVHIRREGQTKYHSLNRSLLASCFASLLSKD